MDSRLREVSCLVCGMSLREGRLVHCKACETAHHQDCWEYNGGCATYGCFGGSTGDAREPAAAKAAPPRAGFDAWRTVVIPVVAVVALNVASKEKAPPPPEPPPPQTVAVPQPMPQASRWRTPALDSIRDKVLTPAWRTAIDGTPQPDAVACPVQDSRPVVVASRSQLEEILSGFDASSGKKLWTTRYPATGGPGTLAAAAIGDRVAVLRAHFGLQVLERSSGRELSGFSGGSPTAGNTEVLGVDHAEVSLGGRGYAVQIGEAGAFTSGVAGLVMESGNFPGASNVLGAGRGVAVVQNRKLGVELWKLGADRPLWTTPHNRPATTALVRMNYIFVGGESLWAFDRASGKLLDTVTVSAPIRRIDERSWHLYVMDFADRLSVFDLDSRRFLYMLSDVARFQYQMMTEAVVGAGGVARIVDFQSGEPLARARLEAGGRARGVPGTGGAASFVQSPAGWLRTADDRLVLEVLGGPGGAYELCAYALRPE